MSKRLGALLVQAEDRLGSDGGGQRAKMHGRSGREGRSPAALANHRGCAFAGDGRSKEEALHKVASHLAKGLVLVVVLDALGKGGDAERGTHLDEAREDGPGAAAGGT